MPAVSCPNCSRKLNVAEEAQGKKIRCRFCGHQFLGPATERKRLSILTSISVQIAIGATVACIALAVLLYDAERRAKNSEIGIKTGQERAAAYERHIAELTKQLAAAKGEPSPPPTKPNHPKRPTLAKP